MSSANFAGQFVTGYGYLSTGADYPSPDYELSSHTRGIQLQAADQLNAQNLLTFTGNYTTANVTRWNNQWYAAPPSVTNLVGANGQCYECSGSGDVIQLSIEQHRGNVLEPDAVFVDRRKRLRESSRNSPACAANANFIVTVPQGYGTINEVQPQFSSAALQDEFRPNDKLDLNLGVRFESYVYDLQNTDTAENNFWFAQAANAYCYDPGTGQPILVQVPIGSPPSQAGPVIAPNSGSDQREARIVLHIRWLPAHRAFRQTSAASER